MKEYNKILKRLIYHAKADFYNKTFDNCKNDSKKTWQKIKEVIKSESNTNLPEYMLINQEKVTDKKQIVNEFNNYFNNTGTQMAESIQSDSSNAFKDHLCQTYNTTFNFQNVNESDIKNIIKSLNSKSSTGYDGISTVLLKKLQSVLIRPITLIINQSLNSGIFPSKLKLAKIIPIHKKDNVHLVENYRPISLLPAISKVFEKVVLDQLYSYFIQNDYLSESQYGFRKFHSTEYAILEVVDRISFELDKGNSLLAIFLDLSKAFDTLNPDILLYKLKYYGINNSALQWFESYLNNRSHYVEIDNIKSDKCSLSLGVPQGSILGPLLFTIYLNDIQSASTFFNYIQYADDTSLLNSIQNLDSTTINTELGKVHKWLSDNMLSLNIKKTKFMLFHNKQKKILTIPMIKIQDIIINRVTNFNFLGIMLNENLNWSTHTDKISVAISRGVGILYKLKHFFPTYVLKTLYYSFDYASFIICYLGMGNLQ